MTRDKVNDTWQNSNKHFTGCTKLFMIIKLEIVAGCGGGERHFQDGYNLLQGSRFKFGFSKQQCIVLMISVDLG